MDTLSQLENQLFQLRMLEAEGKHFEKLEAEVWQDIEEEICKLRCPKKKGKKEEE